MPFTVQSPFMLAEERRRRQLDEIASGFQPMMGGMQDYVAQMNDLAKEKRGNEHDNQLQEAKHQNALRLVSAKDARRAAEEEADAAKRQQEYATGLDIAVSSAQPDMDDEPSFMDDSNAESIADAFGKVQENVDAGSDAPPMMSPKQQKAVDDARYAAARADAMEKKAKGGGPKDPKAPMSPKERKAEADAKIAEAKADAIVQRGDNNNFALTQVTKNDLQKKRILLTEQQKASNAVRQLTTRYDLDKYIGPADSVWLWIEGKLGFQSTEEAEIASTIRRAFTEYKVAATGAAAGIKEMADLESTVPNTKDSLESLIGKLNAGDRIASEGMRLLDDQLSAGDVRGAASGGADKKSRRLARIAELKAQGVSKEQGVAILKSEGLTDE